MHLSCTVHVHVSIDQALCLQSFVNFCAWHLQVCALSKLHGFEEPCGGNVVELLLVLLRILHAAVFVHDHACVVAAEHALIMHAHGEEGFVKEDIASAVDLLCVRVLAYPSLVSTAETEAKVDACNPPRSELPCHSCFLLSPT